MATKTTKPNKVKWPKTLGDYKLVDKNKDGDAAGYEPKIGFGIVNRMEVGVCKIEHEGLRPVQVDYLQNNGCGKKPNLMRLNVEIWRSIDEFFGSFTGMTYVPKGKRKPIPVESMSSFEFEAWCETLPEEYKDKE